MDSKQKRKLIFLIIQLVIIIGAFITGMYYSNKLYNDRIPDEWFVYEKEASFEISEPVSVDIRDDIAFVLDKTSNLHIINISNKENLEQISAHLLGGVGNTVKIRGNYAYISYSHIFAIVNISDLENPETLRVIPLEKTIKYFTIDGNYSFVANGYDGLIIINITTPNQAENISQYTEVNYYADHIHYHNNLVYISDSFDQFSILILNVSDPLNPTRAGYFSNFGTPPNVYSCEPSEVEIYKELMVILDENFGIILANLTNPVVPFRITSYTAYGEPIAVYFDKDVGLMYLFRETGVLEVVRIDTNYNFKLAGRTEELENGLDFYYINNVFYVIDEDGFYIYIIKESFEGEYYEYLTDDTAFVTFNSVITFLLVFSLLYLFFSNYERKKFD